MNPSASPSQKWLMPRFEGSVPTELSGDYILPDTFPDVKRILRTTARPMLISRYASGKRLEYTGAVDYTVLFSSDESREGEPAPESLHAVHFAEEFSGVLNEIAGLDGGEISIDPVMQSCTARLQNPRKLSIKASLTSAICVASPTALAPVIDGPMTLEEELSLEKLTAVLPTLKQKRFLAGPYHISENLEPDGSQPAIDELVSCEASIHFNEARPSLDGGLRIALKGEAVIDCLYMAQGEASDWRSFTRKLPISASVDGSEYAAFFDGAKEETLAAAVLGTVTEVSAAVGENSYGERRVVELDLAYEMDCRLLADTDTLFTMDVYATDREAVCDRRMLELTSLGKVVNANFSVSESFDGDGLLPAAVIGASAEAGLSCTSADRGRAILTGEAELSVLLRRDGGFHPALFTLPLKCELNTGEIGNTSVCECTCHVTDLRVRADSGRLLCDFEVALTAVFLKKHRMEAVETVHCDREASPACEPAGGITLCYPSEGESLWSIAKRYKTTAAAIEAANPDAADSRVLFIPRRTPLGKVI